MSTATYIGELEDWQKMLVHFRQENSMLKIRLSELVDKSVLADFLKKAEYFHNELLANDESIRLIMDSVKYQYHNIKNGRNSIPEKVQEQRVKLKQTITMFNKRFTALNDQFNAEMLSVPAR